MNDEVVLVVQQLSKMMPSYVRHDLTGLKTLHHNLGTRLTYGILSEFCPREGVKADEFRGTSDHLESLKTKKGSILIAHPSNTRAAGPVFSSPLGAKI